MSVLLAEPPKGLSRAFHNAFEEEADDRFETVDGIDVELPPMSADSKGVAADLAVALTNYGVSKGIGKAYPELKVALPLDRDVKRIPDVIFVTFTAWPANRRLPRDDAWAIRPDLCVEVISPTDLMRTYEDKLKEYFEAGVKQVWIVDPDLATVRVYTSRRQSRLFERNDTLTGGDILPGFELPLSELFLEAAPAP